jgi:hypothetical protein
MTPFGEPDERAFVTGDCYGNSLLIRRSGAPVPRTHAVHETRTFAPLAAYTEPLHLEIA